jgi:ATP-dependent DNA ligase
MSGRVSRRHDNSQPLPLALPTAPAASTRVSFEMAIACSRPFDGEEWRFSVDWAGARTFLTADDQGNVRLQDQMRRDVSGRYPEIVEAGLALGGRAVVLDGVVAVLDDEGKPSLERFAKRTVSGADPNRLPVAFLATDLLLCEGKNFMRKPLDERWAKLGEVLLPDENIQRPDDVPGQGTALALAAAERGLTTLVARRRSATYSPGVATPNRLRIALSNRTALVVMAVERSRSRANQRRFVLGEHADGELLEVCAVVKQLDAATAEWIEHAQPLTAVVDYDRRNQSGELLGAELVAVRDDLDPLWCQRVNPAPPPAGDAGPAEFGFRPTVIPALPIPD